MDITLLYGRRELHPIIDQSAKIPPCVQLLPTMEVGHHVRCLRCNSLHYSAKVQLPRDQYYCPTCINLGRVSTLDQFYHVPEPNEFESLTSPLTWCGKLSPLQEKISNEVRISMKHHERRLLWAVTGAGKTEMIFSTIEQAIQNRERICIASPRVDVCLELFPRLQAAFKSVEMVLLHGKQDEPYRYCQVTVCTTHQLLRFYHAFDLLIVDEVDSFPYAANQQLIFATEQAKKEDGGLLMMTATPGELLTRAVKTGKLKVSYLPLRYHGHLLPTIQRLRINNQWQQKLGQGKFPLIIKKLIQKRLQQKQRFLLFVPRIDDLPKISKILKHEVSQARFTTVHATDENRLQKVQRMRDDEYDFLVTTTILERGVTFPEIDVGVIGADDDVFSSSALVQIAGRVGRSSNRPTGSVTFFINENSRNVQLAVKQIGYMNRLGKRLI